MRLSFPDDVFSTLRRKYARNRERWLAGEGAWPLEVSLGIPTERQAAEDLPRVRQWVAAWDRYDLAGSVVWEERQWQRLGSQRLPRSLVFEHPQAVATALGLAMVWEAAARRYAHLVTRLPALAATSALTSQFEFLATAEEPDFRGLINVLEWLDQHPASGLYPRQLPVAGVDSKWLESRAAMVHRLLGPILARPEAEDFFNRSGLRRAPFRVRMRVLCPELQVQLGGLTDIEAPLSEVGRLKIKPARCIAVENLASGLALPEMPGTVSFMGLGNAVSMLGTVPWLAATDLWYWGDIDTHGFAILSRLRREFPNVRSLLMDEATLLGHRELWVEEPVQAADIYREGLSEAEFEVFQGLRTGRWGCKVRLEQERIPWHTVVGIFPP